MAISETFNCDCMEYMKTLPDNYFDLACVDPPYGDACSQSLDVERERERERERKNHDITASEVETAYLKSISVIRTGGTWAQKYAKKLLRGMLPQNKNTLMNCFASHAIR